MGSGCCSLRAGELVPELSGGHTEHHDDLRLGTRRHRSRRAKRPLRAYPADPCQPQRFYTVEGVAFLDVPAFCVQYHPEAAPGPTDAHYLFTAFVRLMEGRKDYLTSTSLPDRLAGWRFGAEAAKELTNA